MEQNPAHQYLTSGTYTVCLTASSVCGENTTCQPVEVIIINSYEVLAQTDLEIYPNPADQQITIDWPSAPSQWELSIWDLQGRQLRHYGPQNSSQTTIDLTGLPSGYYLVRGQGDLGPWTRSLIID